MMNEKAPAIRTLIVDDEPLARKTVRMLLADDEEIEIIGEAGNGKDAVAAIREQKPDLLFLDVQMPALDGIGVMRTIGAENMPVTIFVTAYDQYALKAFEVHALDYLLKPYDDERFEQALERAKQQVRRAAIESLSQRLFSLMEAMPGQKEEAPQYLSRIMVKGSGPIVFLKVEEIDWIEAADYYVQLHVGGRTHLLRESLRNLDQQLDPSCFMRIHRSAIVNLDRVRKLQPDARGEYQVILQDGTTLKLGRGRREALQEKLMGLG